MSGLRVVSWNVRSLRDDAAGVARVLAGLAPDVVLLQEAPRLLGSGWANRRLARRAGLTRVAGGAAAHGNLLLVGRRTTVVTASVLRLPRRPGLHRRGAVVGVVELAGARLAVAGTHLDLDPLARLDSARRVRTAAAGLGNLLVLCADVNEEPGGPAWAELSAGLVDTAAACGPTFPLRAPRRRIDVLLADPRLVVQAVEVPRVGPVTDHLPLVLDLAWPPGRTD
ncbi:MAG: endonuclease/exonuclease/phosphatase family protein [Frankiaceae bacterium]|nr:endonuclease/exonuclease/phosphatase family protein [Frankiaceae bacterium]